MSISKNTNRRNTVQTLELVDNIPGIGKSTAIGKWMIQHKDTQRVVYITPFRSELDRFIEDYPEMNFHQPSNENSTTLKEDFIRLVVDGENIVTTHATFKNLKPSDTALITHMGYTLIMDETIEAFEQMAISKMNCDAYERLGWIKVDEDNLIHWNFDDYPYDKIDDRDAKKLVNLMATSLVYRTAQGVFVSEFPYKVITCFKRVIVVTYLFEGTLLYHWAKINGLGVENITSDLTFKDRKPVIEAIKNNLHIVTTPKFEGLTHTWYKKSKKLDSIQSKITSFVYNSKVKVGDILITCPKEYWKHDLKQEGLTKARISELRKINNSPTPKLNGDRYRKATWAASNSRATNKYADKNTIIYGVNKYLCPTVSQHISNRGSAMDEDQYALAEMIQFIWRGCIRNSEPMKVFVPSERMHKLLVRWVEGLE